jgi:phosphopantetheinyl transferase
MALIFEKKIGHHTKVAVWQSTEESAYFADALDLTTSERQNLEHMHPRRQKEWLTSRFLIHRITDARVRVPVDKDFCGKPSLQGTHQHISISHSRDMVAVAYSDHCVGIDIQHEEEKIIRIKDKFISAREASRIDSRHTIESYHIFWGAKECMYKAYGLKELDFRKHMHVFPFKYYQEELSLRGWVKKDSVHQDYLIHTDRLGPYFLLVASMI